MLKHMRGVKKWLGKVTLKTWFVCGGVSYVLAMVVLAGLSANEIIMEEFDLIEYIKTTLIGLGGLGGLYGLVLGAKRTNNAQTQLFNERMGRGLELLANEQVTLRVAGVRLLDNLAKSANHDEAELVVDILRDYINTKAKIKKDKKGEIMPKTPEPREHRADIELCVHVIGKHAIDYEHKWLDSLDLRGLDFSYTDLSKVKLIGVNMTNTNLERINLAKAKLKNITLKGTNLSGANLAKAHLHSANLIEANLQRAILKETCLHQANLREANLLLADMTKAELLRATLTKATLLSANMTEAHLAQTNLKGAELFGANLTKSNLWKANLTKANLYKAKLTGAYLWGADLKGANLRDANLTEVNLTDANLTQEQFNQIIFKEHNPPQNIPDGLTLPEDRAYVKTSDGKRVFIKSDKPWSEKNLDDYF